VLRLAVTTSTMDSGLLDVLVPDFEKQRGVRVDVIAVGTGAALALGRAGDVDVVLVHARAAEDAFMNEGHGIRREDLMYNTFEILGPSSDPGLIRNLTPVEAFRAVADHGLRFVSRGDNSGTHQRELKLWQAGGGRPTWEGYVESGQSMGATLIMADQMQAYVLSDRGTYLKFKDKIDIIPLLTSSVDLQNPYGIIVVNPGEHAGVNADLAQAFVDYMVSATAQRRIRDYQIEGESLFYPLRLSNRK
jgi:tungstate transport system substrate-binding protein